MEFDVYCDESRQDSFKSKNSSNEFLVIGSLWLPTDKRSIVKREIKNIRHTFSYHSEIKWNKVSKRYKDFYTKLIEYFFELGLDLRFRCIVVEANNVDFVKYHNNDEELGFYKFYYQMIHHWILDFNQYNIFCDLKTNRVKNRLNVLHKCLRSSNLSSIINKVQALPSKEVDLLQLTDLLLGAASSGLNSINLSNDTKIAIISLIENNINFKKIRHTPLSEQKFNVFKIDLKGGW